ncbi:MAG: glutaredoxin family protein [Pseudomonadota bacterium]
MKVSLYTTAGCHLCEQALALLLESDPPLEICEVEISESESLMQTYGVRIPVIRVDGSTAELGWPFDSESLAQFIHSQD